MELSICLYSKGARNLATDMEFVGISDGRLYPNYDGTDYNKINPMTFSATIKKA